MEVDVLLGMCDSQQALGAVTIGEGKLGGSRVRRPVLPSYPLTPSHPFILST